MSMGNIRNQIFAHFDLGHMTAVGMLLFLAVFLGALIWVTRRNGSSFYASMQNLPFND